MNKLPGGGNTAEHGSVLAAMCMQLSGFLTLPLLTTRKRLWHCHVVLLQRYLISDSTLKSNDLVIDGGKVAGILLEQKNGKLIAGIGINLVSCPDSVALRRNAALPATCLSAINPRVARELTPESIVKNLLERLGKLDLDSFSRLWRQQALSRLLWLNEPVCLDVDDSVVTGTLAGIDERGGLLLASQGGIKTYMRGAIRKLSN